MKTCLAPFVLSACLLLAACGNTGAPAEDYGPLLIQLTEGVILPEHQAFASRADELEEATQSLAATPTDATLHDAQEAWRAARKAYRMLDAVKFGPGYSLHVSERIDASPSDFDGIETLAAAAEPASDATVAAAGGRKKGFLGLEYLLFAASDGSAPAPVLASDEAAPQRRALAFAMAREIAQSAHQLDAAWQPSGGGFGTDVEQAGQASSHYRTQRAAVNDLAGAVGAALEYIVRDGLRGPLGKSSGGIPAPELDLTPRSDNAVADMQASLAGVNALYQQGFSALIHSKSAELDRTVLAQLSESEKKLVAIPAPFAQAVVDHTLVVDAAYDATRALKATWNTEVSSALGASVQISDGDGD